MTTRVILANTDLLNCLVCFRQFDTKTRKPKVLFCGHTFCEECTTHLVIPRDFRHPSSEQHLRCPTCRQFNTRSSTQKYATNFQILGALEEKMKLDREKGGESIVASDDKLHFTMPRSKSFQIHVATKKGLASPEMIIRNGGDGDTSMVIAGSTGSTEEIVNYINEHRVAIETGLIRKMVVHEGKHPAKDPVEESFAKVASIPPGQSALKLTSPPKKLEEATFTDSFELKAVEENGRIILELVRISDPPNGLEVFGGSMAKPSTKQPAKRQQPSTSTECATDAPAEPPVSKRTRRGRAN